MEDLLSKYNHQQPHTPIDSYPSDKPPSPHSRTLDPSILDRDSRAIRSRGHSTDRMGMVPLGLPTSKRNSLDLPSISPRRNKKATKQVKPSKPKQSKPQDPYFLDTKLPQGKDRTKQILQKAYLQDRPQQPLRQSKSHTKPPTQSQL
jgi:hypothetical protein